MGKRQWEKQLFLFLKEHKNEVDTLLCTEWNVFSRDSGCAIIDMQRLAKHGIEMKAIGGRQTSVEIDYYMETTSMLIYNFEKMKKAV